VLAALGGHQFFDSLAVDGAGHVCVATIVTGAVSDIWPDGSRVDQYLLPDPIVTNVCFGGRALGTAFAPLPARQAGRLRLAATGRSVEAPQSLLTRQRSTRSSASALRFSMLKRPA